ncbi:MAG: glutamate 5-kinase [Clostridia bacterium]|jgi:glutamate 5-kinase|nr:glutamate 5-kinase [Clostridia bacterium]
MRDKIKKAKRIIVKIGTSSLTHENGKVNLDKMEKLSRVLTDINNSGKEVILVSSGAIGAGMQRIGRNKRPEDLPLKQATAAIGQAILMQMYQKFFGEYNQVIAQILLTKDVIEDEIKKTNAKNTFDTLLDLGVIPIINENDCISTAQIEGYRFGDNDTLSATVAQLVQADVLILLTDIDGLYTDNPKQNSDAVLIPKVEDITPEIEGLASGAGSRLGTGGMATKIIAAKIAKSCGTDTIVASGEDIQILSALLQGEELGTWFVAN